MKERSSLGRFHYCGIPCEARYLSTIDKNTEPDDFLVIFTRCNIMGYLTHQPLNRV